MGKNQKVTAGDIVARLRSRYAADKGWAVVAEVRNRLGWRSDRSIDFLAVQTWDSKAPYYVAIEIKVTRTDFARELQSPGKRRVWEKVATEFWFAAPRGVIPEDELPEGAGLLETAGQGIRATRKATQYRDHEPTVQIWTNVLRRLVERMVDQSTPDRSFAEFAGRSVSIEDLRRLAGKLAEPGSTSRREKRVREDVARERARTIEWQRREEPILAAARKLARAVLERGGIGPEEVARVVARVATGHEITGDCVRMALELRQAAEILHPGGAL